LEVECRYGYRDVTQSLIVDDGDGKEDYKGRLEVTGSEEVMMNTLRASAGLAPA
jgi:hypothetical protein